MRRYLIVIPALLTFYSHLWAGEINPLPYKTAETKDQDSSTAGRTLLVAGVSAGLAGSLLTIGTFAWWKDPGYTGWGWKDTGLFGPNTYAGGSDKAGHIYACYLTGKASTQIYEWLGVSRRNALALGTGFTLFISNVVEVVDGFTPHDFEWSDVLTNLIGLSYFLAEEKFPEIDALFGLRIGYVPTPEFIKGEKNYIKLVNDFSGMIFYVDFKPAGIEKVFDLSPGLARYFTFGLTYGTYGYSPKGPIKRRNLGVYIGLDLSELLEAIFGTESKGIRAGSTFSRYYALPFTTASFNHDLNHQTRAVNFGAANRWQLDQCVVSKRKYAGRRI